MKNLHLQLVVVFLTLFGGVYTESQTFKSAIRRGETTDSTTTFISSTLKLRTGVIPDRIFNMTNLSLLSIEGMDCDYGDTFHCWMIREIPDKIANLKKLESLMLKVNAIRTLPKEISELKQLKLLDLSDNAGLSDVEAVVGLKELEELSLFGCGLSKLPQNIGRLKKTPLPGFDR